MGKQDQLLEMKSLMTSWKFNKIILASKMPMNAYTFKMKIAGKPPYKFTEYEIERLREVLQELAQDIVKVTEINFKNPVAKIAGKKK